MTERFVELGPGTGVVAVIGDVCLFVADQDAADPLVAAARAAGAGTGSSGRRLARGLAALVVADDSGRGPDFGAIAALDDGWVVVLHGAVVATIVVADGTEELLSGESSVTWTDRTLPATTGAVLLGPVELARPGASPLRLEAGVVPGGWLRLVPTAPEGPAAPRAAFELFSLSPADVETRAPLPIEGVTAVHAPATTAAAPPGPAPDELSQDQQRTSLGLLVFDDGSAFGLDDDYVLGREPEIDESVVAGSARPITLDDPADTVSRVHAEIRLVASDVRLIDRGSTNGTHVWDESRGAWERLEPGLPRVIRPGERGAVGRRTFVYEVVERQVVVVTRPMPEVVTINPRRDRVLVGATGEAYPLDRSYVIGRDPLSDDAVRRALASPIVIRDDQQVSRVHAHVSVSDAAVHVRDAGTVGGTFIAPPGASSWQVVDTEPVELRPGWSLRVGAHVFTFRSEADTDSAQMA